MISRVALRNYRSFINAETNLAAFTLVLGANGAGKTNFLRAFVDASPWLVSSRREGFLLPHQIRPLPPHFNNGDSPSELEFEEDTGPRVIQHRPKSHTIGPGTIELFRLNPERISAPELISGRSFVAPDGSGTTQTLEALKNGDQEELFDAAEKALTTYVPEITKLSFATAQQGQKQMQVREAGIGKTVPADQLSEGTRLIVALLAIVYQPIKPPVICLEDIDRGMHPRVFEQIVGLMRRLATDAGVQIIATTHNPYLLDCFQDDLEAVVIVEKEKGASKLSTVSEKLDKFEYDKTNPEDIPLGALWFSGIVGGVPNFLQKLRT